MAYEELTALMRECSRIVFFGGAGVSTASGIPDFRSSSGLYHEKFRRTLSPEEMVSHSFLMQHPDDFYAFYKEKLIYPDAEPNGAHRALARLEEMGKLTSVVTQNIDGLHQAAGSRRVWELHGSVLRNYCTKCHASYGADYVLAAPGVPVCEKCGAPVRPDVVLYEECLDDRVIEGAVRDISRADMLIIGGTSLVVYPAAGLIHYFRGRHLVLINKSVTEADSMAELVYHDDIAAVLDQAVQNLVQRP